MSKTKILAVLAAAQGDLFVLARDSQREIDFLSAAFRKLAGEGHAVLQDAAAIAGRVEKENMSAVLPQVEGLCRVAKESIERRLEAAATILAGLEKEDLLLRRLTIATHAQKSIALHLTALSVLTNVEVSHLGDAGGNFKVLAQELSAFSAALSAQTLQLAGDTQNRRQTLAETQGALGAKLPRLRRDIVSMEDGMAAIMALIAASLNHQISVPEQFRKCAAETARQISGVVEAIQATDISRQQIEHVQQSLDLIAARMNLSDFQMGDWADVYAGLNVQLFQMRNIQETVKHWSGQARNCMQAIAQLSVTEVMELAPAVTRQEGELSRQLAQIEIVQQSSREYSAQMQSTLGGLSSLANLVQDSLQRSRGTRERLQILTFNSLIEAQRLGHGGAVVSRIASLIGGVSQQWNELADQALVSLTELLALARHTGSVAEASADTGSQQLKEEQTKTRSTLDQVRGAAAFVAEAAARMHRGTNHMQAELASLREKGNRLDGCFERLDAALGQVEALTADWLREDPKISGRCDAAGVERWLGDFYTTEIERHILSAALHGTALPVSQPSLAGNEVELF